MVDQPDVAAVAPALEVTIDYVSSSVRCVGRVDARTDRYVIEAVTELLTQVPPHLTIDIRELHVVDGAGADALLRVEGMVRRSGRRLRWRKPAGDHIGGIVRPFPRAP